MTLKRFNFILILLVAGICIASCTNIKTTTPHQSDQEPVIDGDMSDWPASDSIIFQGDYFDYYLMYNSDYLYIYVDFLSPFHNQAVNASGFTIYMSRDDKNRKQSGIGFPSGSLNQLRENPGIFEQLTTDPEWLNNPDNYETLDIIEQDNFTRLLIVERHESGSSPQYGFVTKSQVEAQDIELAAETERRYYGLEYKFPLNGSLPFDLEPGNTYWLGFAIEPPVFRYPDDSSMTSQDRYYRRQYGTNLQRSSSRSDQNYRMQQNLGQYEDWFKIRIE